MITCAPQRYLANNRNALRTAVLTPSSVQAVDNSVLEIPTPRNGTAQVALTGSYTGAEEATYDVEIVNDTVATNLISAPIFAGAGSGSLSGISSTLPAQDFTVELADNGVPITAAGVDFDGVTIKARNAGAAGNAIRITIDQTPLAFATTNFSLLATLPAGSGASGVGLIGPAFDWDTKVLGADNLIPADAHRIAFAGNTSDVYLQYKQYVNSKWEYFLVPELKRDVVAGTPVLFVTGGRTVVVSDTITPESYADIVTLYDLLNALKTLSVLVDVDGVVANDRTPTGQASLELLTRTDAHVEPSSGTGSQAATGFINTFAASDAGTELVTAKCFAITNKDYPTAQLGSEAWKLKSSLRGDLGVLLTNVPYIEPTGKFGLTIPQRLPDGFGAPKGRFEVADIIYVARPVNVDPPPICVVAKTLGPAAIDMGIKLKYTKRPSGECLCNDLPVPDLAGPCIGTIEGAKEGPVSYSPEALVKIKSLYDFARDVAAAVTKAVQGYAHDGIPEDNIALSTLLTVTRTDTIDKTTVTNTQTQSDSLKNLAFDNSAVASAYFDVALPPDFNAVLDDFETALVAIDAVTDTTLKADGFTAWDDALEEFQDDLGMPGSPGLLAGLGGRLETIATEKYAVMLRRAQVYAGVSTLGKSKASSEVQSGDGCWHDLGDPFYWVATGSDGRVFGAAFNNKPFYSSVACGVANSADGHILGKFYATHEFAFQINIACPERLLVNDEIDLTIGNSSYGSTYQIGDELLLPIIAAQPLFLAGGQDGSVIETWYVSGTVAGPLPNFVFDPNAPAPYSTPGSPADLAFTLNVGGIPYAQGDKFTFSIEGGHYRWRKDVGAWSSAIAIPATMVAFDAGLAIEFTPGAFPSFVANDTFSFRALQPWAVSNVQSPTPDRWQWTGAAPTLVADLGSDQTLDMAAIALHTLPAGATITIEGGTSPGVYTWLETLAQRPGVIFGAFGATRTARYVRLTLGGATDAGIGWWWIGQGLSTELGASIQLRRAYKVIRGSAGLRNVGKFVGKAISGDIEWTEGVLTEADAAAISAMVDWIKENDDEPFVLVPQVTRPAEAIIAQVIADEVEITDISDYNRDAAFDRRFAAKLPLAGVW